jgi:hypothetical protein
LNALVVTTPVNALFFVTLIVIEPLRFWFVLIVAVDGTVKVKSGMDDTTPE